MYEPIIDPMIFYWIELVEKLQLAPICVGILGVVLACSFPLYLMEADLPTSQENKIIKIAITIFSVLFIATSLLAFLAPSKDTMYKMLIAKQVTPHNLQVTGETVDKALDKVVEKIIKVTQEVKK
mgnify:FL=1